MSSQGRRARVGPLRVAFRMGGLWGAKVLLRSWHEEISKERFYHLDRMICGWHATVARAFYMDPKEPKP